MHASMLETKNCSGSLEHGGHEREAQKGTVGRAVIGDKVTGGLSRRSQRACRLSLTWSPEEPNSDVVWKWC